MINEDFKFRKYKIIRYSAIFITDFFLIDPESVQSAEYKKADVISSKEEINNSRKKDTLKINRQLEVPLSGYWLLGLENTMSVTKGDSIQGTEWEGTFSIRPEFPYVLGDNNDWLFASRLTFSGVTKPELDPTYSDGVADYKTGFGDLELLSILGPNRKKGTMWGFGVTFKFPTASDKELGQEKYQAGPAAKLFIDTKSWGYGVLIQNWWSYAGNDNAPDISEAHIDYSIRYYTSKGLEIGMRPTITIDWKSDRNDRITLPIGLGFSKTYLLEGAPIKLRAELQYSIIRPESYGNQWNILFEIIPVIKCPQNREY